MHVEGHEWVSRKRTVRTEQRMKAHGRQEREVSKKINPREKKRESCATFNKKIYLHRLF